MKSVKLFAIALAVLAAFTSASMVACDDFLPDSDTIQQAQQERLLKEGTAQTGMPNIVNFRERRILKDILELRDQKGLDTYTYFYNQMTGKLVFLCASEGYAIPYSTEYTNPQKTVLSGNTYLTLPQADPNGLFPPSAAEGTWVLCQNPHSEKADVQPVYVEPRIITSPFPLQ